MTGVHHHVGELKRVYWLLTDVLRNVEYSMKTGKSSSW